MINMSGVEIKILVVVDDNALQWYLHPCTLITFQFFMMEAIDDVDNAVDDEGIDNVDTDVIDDNVGNVDNDEKILVQCHLYDV